MEGGGSGHISEMNRTAEKNRNALKSHNKNRTGVFFKSKLKKFNPARKESKYAIAIPVITVLSVGVIILISYIAIQNYMNYENRPATEIHETSDISRFLKNMDSGKAKMKDKDYKAAVQYFEAALEIYPNNSEAQNALKETKKRLEYQN